MYDTWIINRKLGVCSFKYQSIVETKSKNSSDTYKPSIIRCVSRTKWEKWKRNWLKDVLKNVFSNMFFFLYHVQQNDDSINFARYFITSKKTSAFTGHSSIMEDVFFLIKYRTFLLFVIVRDVGRVAKTQDDRLL